MVQVALVALADWTAPEFVETIWTKIDRVAASERSNTEYTGLASTWSKSGGR
jgi:hypothetical protein